ncbi:MAG TPA: protein kinase [Myxococcaceae bacterium]
MSLHGQGTYGAVYRASSVGQDEPVPVALKLALNLGDPRFAREVKLLSRLDHPSIPRILDHRSWKHPAGAAYPYLVMEWVDGLPLYAWAGEHNPTSRQVLRLLAQLTQALQAVHAAGAVHRDVKGDNVLVRSTDRRAVLTDFGSANYRGAARLTWQTQPPGTPAYRSPEAWQFLLRFGLASDAHYVATPADDLFALGVTAYRLVTGEYPPSPEPGLEEARAWAPDGPGPKPPHTLNPQVASRLSELILQMLSAAPEARGTAATLAQALELAAESASPEADQPLFESRPQPTPTKTDAPAPVKDSSESVRTRERAVHWLPWLAAVAVGLALLLWAWPPVHMRAERVFARAPVAPGTNTPDAGTTGVGERSMKAPPDSEQPPTGQEAVADDEPPELFPRQATPDEKGQCPVPGQVAINGGCWVEQKMSAAECEKNGYVVQQSKCYAPSFSLKKRRKPTSSPSDSR